MSNITSKQRLLTFETLRPAVLNSLHEALTNQKYWSARARGIQKFDQWINVLVVFFSLSTVVSGLANIDFLWKILSIILALLSVAMPIINWAEKAELSSDLARDWGEVFHEYEKIWIEIEMTDFETVLHEEIISIKSDFDGVKKKQTNLIGKDGKISEDKKLREEIKKEVDIELRDRLAN